jgi:hypothetical protein
MTDLPNSTPDGATPAGDPELAALVQHDDMPDDADPSLAALVANAGAAGSPTAGAAPAGAATVDAPPPGDPTDAGPADTSPTSEPGIDAVPVLPLTASVTDGALLARPRRRRSLALRYGVAFVLGF